ncbi:MAG: PilZ domain-containing protein [bacterium]
MFDEKRKHGRVPLVLEASWEGSGSRSLARTTDISETGCFIDTQAEVAVGDILHIKLIPPDGDCISAQSEVIYRQRGVGFGVRFWSISDADRFRLNALLNAQMLTRRT